MAEYIEREAVLRDWPLCDEPADAYQFIRGFPAADVVERKTGKWLSIPNGKIKNWKRKCSVCGLIRRGKTTYCPECGAKMEG